MTYSPRRIDTAELYEVAPRRSVRGHLQDVWKYRELLGQLVRRELKVRYKNSALGFLWSMLNPAFLMLIYWLVFAVYLKNRQPNFPIWILCGLLVWNFFLSAMTAGTTSITANSYLVGKVRFPREILPLATVGAALVHFLLQSLVLLGALAVFQVHPDYTAFLLVVPAIIVVTILVSALAIGLSAINVYARDTQFLLELALMAWFWLTPILIPYSRTATQLNDKGVAGSLLLLNPMTSIVTTMQRAFYGQTHAFYDGVDNHFIPGGSLWWYARNLGYVLVVALVLLTLAIRFFDRAEGNFAEVL